MAIFGRGSSSPSDLLSARAEYDALTNAHSERIQRMQMYRDEGNRVRDPNLNMASAEVNDYGRRQGSTGQKARHRIPLPMGKALTVKHAYRIAGQLPDVVVDQRDNSPEEQHRSDTMEKIVWAIMRRSRVETAFASASWHASEMGSACFDMYWSMKDQMPIFRAVDPTGILEVQGVNDPHDFERVYRSWDAPLESVKAQYAGKEFRGEPINTDQLSPLENKQGTEMVRIVQLCDRERLIRFAVCGSESVVGLYEYVHNYGFSPYVVIPNIGPYDDVWGWADYEFIRAISDYMSMLFSREADVLRAVAAGAYKEKKTGQAAAVIQDILAKGGIIPMGREGELEPVEVAQMPTFADEHAKRGMDFIKMLGFAPDASWGLPGSGSGTDRGLQLQPLLEYTAMKQLNWQSGLSRMFGMAYQMIEQKMVGKQSYRGASKLSGNRRMPFVMTLGPDAESLSGSVDAEGLGAPVSLSMKPAELFDGDYDVRFVWRNRVDPEDPQYVMSELNKFTSGIQSLETTLENLGVQAPEDEMRRIEKEAERFPWVNQGLVSLITSQISGGAQGQGGGAPPDPAGAVAGAMETMTSLGGGGKSGALNTDAGAGALGADAIGVPYGAA